MASHFLGPILNREKIDGDRQWFSNLPMIAGPDYSVVFNDFLKAGDYSTTDFTLTLVNSGTAAVNTSSNQVGGYLVLTTDVSSADSTSLQGKQESFKLSAGKRLWFEIKLKASNVATVDLLAALAITDTTPLDASDYVGFRMTTGAATIDCKTVAGSTATTSAAVASLVANTDKKLGFYWDGISRVFFFVDRAQVAVHTANISTEDLAPVVHIKTNSGNARSCSIDYIFVAQER